MKSRPRFFGAALRCASASLLLAVASAAHLAQSAPGAPGATASAPPRDGSHDFDFLHGDWKVYLRRLPDRLVGSTNWLEYRGFSRTRPFLASSANVEEFDVDGGPGRHIKAQTLRLYNPVSGQWSLYLLDVDKGLLPMPPTVGQFTDGRGEFFDQEEYRGRMILVRYVWTHPDASSARMEQSFSSDGGKTWEVNWICELSRA